ncbi:hypothetical protein [Brachybacterium sp. FME24]|uniref:hypothetical protein n=1 Tax=Brachybacterium sp. FME24 TaxID=2742605 RepID=UPI001866041E|nr:hypothetical protein [Brachybacterium sp. FME24]
MSALTMILFIGASVLMLAALIFLYFANVTSRKSRGVSRTVIYLGAAAVLVAVAAVLTAL